MDQQYKETLHQLAQDEESAKKLEELFSELENERDTAKEHLNLLENAIRSDYDSIIITTLELAASAWSGRRVLCLNVASNSSSNSPRL